MRSTEDEAEARVDEAEALKWPLAALLALAVVAYAAWRVMG